MLKKVKLPYGIGHFPTIIYDGYVYVDKTQYIEVMEELSTLYHFFLRPRRFGKSLFVSVLTHYYDVKEKDNFEKLFGN
ncbi:MAG: AAA family ATPase, partial [Bacteroidetes bacterium]